VLVHRWVYPVVLLLLLAGIAGVHVAVLCPGHNWGDDFAMYVLHARNLVEGRAYGDTGYVYNPHDPVVGPPTYPPVTAALLAPVYTARGLDFWAMKCVMVGCFTVFLGCVAWLFGRQLPGWQTLGLIAVLGLNWFFVHSSNTINSDQPFLVFLYLSFCLLERQQAATSTAGRLGWSVALGLCMYLAFGARTLGVLLVPSLLIAEGCSARRIRRETLLALGVFACLAGVQTLWLHSDRAYLEQLRPQGAALAAHALSYAQRWAAFFSNGYWKAPAAVLFLLVTALSGLGFVQRLRQRVRALDVFCLLYLAAILAWPSYQGERYLYPLLPLWLFYSLHGLRHPWLAARPRLGRTLVAGVVLVVAGSYVARWTDLGLEAIDEGVTSPNASALFEELRRQTAPDEVLVCIKPRALALLTGRPASVYHCPADDAELWGYLRQIGARYLVTVERDEALGRMADARRSAYLRGFVQRNAGLLEEAYRNADFRVFRILEGPT